MAAFTDQKWDRVDSVIAGGAFSLLMASIAYLLGPQYVWVVFDAFWAMLGRSRGGNGNGNRPGGGGGGA